MYDNETKEAESRDDFGFLKGGETGDGALYESDDDIANPLVKDSIPNEPDIVQDPSRVRVRAPSDLDRRSSIQQKDISRHSSHKTNHQYNQSVRSLH